MNKTILASLISFVVPAMFVRMNMAEGSKSTILDLDNIFDTAMDTVETLPDFVNPPAGNYMLEVTEVKLEKYTPKAKQGEAAPAKDSAARIRITNKVEKTIELADAKELPVKDGSLFSESFMATEDGLKFFKRQALNVMNITDEAVKGVTLKDLMEGLKGLKYMAKIAIRETPNPAGGVYENVQVRPVHETPPATSL